MVSHRIKEGDTESWVREWAALADTVRRTAEAALKAGQTVTAKAAFLPASNYYRRSMRSCAVAALTTVLIAGCGGKDAVPMPTSPTPTVTASVYILPGAVSLNDLAFGDEPIVIYTNERLRWVNADGLTPLIVADSPEATNFRNTNELRPNGGEQSFTMIKLGTTRIHCAIHPNMTGTLIVRDH